MSGTSSPAPSGRRQSPHQSSADQVDSSFHESSRASHPYRYHDNYLRGGERNGREAYAWQEDRRSDHYPRHSSKHSYRYTPYPDPHPPTRREYVKDLDRLMDEHRPRPYGPRHRTASYTRSASPSSRRSEMDSRPALRRGGTPPRVSSSAPRSAAPMKKTESNRAPAAQSSTPAAQSKVPPPQTTASFRPSATVAGNQVDPSRDPRLPRDPHTSKLAASLATPDSRAAPTQPRSQPASTATDQVVGKGRYQIAELSLQRKALEQRIQQLCNLTYCFEIPAIAEISEAYVAFVTQYLQSGTSLSQELVESNMRLAQGAMEKHLIIHQQITRLWDSLQEDHSRLLKEVIALPEDCQE